MDTAILVVEDEEPVRELVTLYLQKEGFQVKTAADGEEALALLRSGPPPALILLDLMLPRMDGWAVCREVRKTLQTPIIMLTARAEEFDRVLGLELGADDYIAKPFSPREMVARVKAVLRRTQNPPSSASEESPPTRKVSYPGLSVDYDGGRVEVAGNEVALTRKEFELLWFLATHPGRIFTREQLLEQVWGYAYLGDARTVDTHIKRLREKLAGPDQAGWARDLIRTVWGRGYKFEYNPPSGTGPASPASEGAGQAPAGGRGSPEP